MLKDPIAMCVGVDGTVMTMVGELGLFVFAALTTVLDQDDGDWDMDSDEDTCGILGSSHPADRFHGGRWA